jgi:hypothetical protein
VGRETTVTPDRTSRNERPQAPHQRDYDPQEGADRPLQAKDEPPLEDRDRDPHAALNHPVGDPDPAATADPYDPDPEAQGDTPPPGEFPGPGPEPSE